jgi:transcriptional regulator with XRE-family HTH domain
MHADGHVHPNPQLTHYSRTAWQIRRRLQDVRDGIVAGAGGEQAVTEARHRNRAYYGGHRLAERRKALGLTQAQVAERMGMTKSRVSQVERGEVSTIDAVARYVQAIGGTIQISAVFGDDRYVLRGHRYRSRLTATSSATSARRHHRAVAGFPACWTSLPCSRWHRIFRGGSSRRVAARPASRMGGGRAET